MAKNFEIIAIKKGKGVESLGVFATKAQANWHLANSLNVADFDKVLVKDTTKTKGVVKDDIASDKGVYSILTFTTTIEDWEKLVLTRETKTFYQMVMEGLLKSRSGLDKLSNLNVIEGEPKQYEISVMVGQDSDLTKIVEKVAQLFEKQALADLLGEDMEDVSEDEVISDPEDEPEDIEDATEEVVVDVKKSDSVKLPVADYEEVKPVEDDPIVEDVVEEVSEPVVEDEIIEEVQEEVQPTVEDEIVEDEPAIEEKAEDFFATVDVEDAPVEEVKEDISEPTVEVNYGYDDNFSKELNAEFMDWAVSDDSNEVYPVAEAIRLYKTGEVEFDIDLGNLSEDDRKVIGIDDVKEDSEQAPVVSDDDSLELSAEEQSFFDALEGK